MSPFPMFVHFNPNLILLLILVYFSCEMDCFYIKVRNERASTIKLENGKFMLCKTTCFMAFYIFSVKNAYQTFLYFCESTFKQLHSFVNRMQTREFSE